MLTMAVRPARVTDLPHLPAIEVAAGEAFREIDMVAVADDAPPPVTAFEERLLAGMLWVAGEDPPRAYLAGDVVDGIGHVLQVSVDPSAAGQGVGAGLLDHFSRWAAERRISRLTLTTFSQVPWNAPYYTRLGWRVLPTEQWGPGLRQIRAHEAELGLDAWPRCVMYRDVL